MSGQRHEDRERSHENWVATLNEARSTCRQALMQASVDVSDPTKALWPAVRRGRMTQEHQTVAQCHAAVLDYAEHVEPYENRCSHIWTEAIRQPHEFPDGDELPVVLREIERWADMRYEESVGRTDELTGQQERTRLRRVHLPTGYARQTFRQLNRCVEFLKLGADIENRTFPTEEKDPGLQHDVD